MKEKSIKIKFVGFPQIYDFFKTDDCNHSFTGFNLKDLVDDLCEKFGTEIMGVLWDQKNEKIDPCIQIYINNRYLQIKKSEMVMIREGDQVIFLKLLAGG